MVGDFPTYRGLFLDTITPDDYPALYELFVGLNEGAIRWRYRGATPSFEDFTRGLWTHVFAHYLARRVSTGEVVGYVSAYAPQVRDGHCYVSAIGVPQVRNRGTMAMATMLLVESVFRMAPFRKMYFESTDSNLMQYKRAVTSGLLIEEGCYQEHEWLDGRFEAVYTLALYRRTWAERRVHFGFTGEFSPSCDPA